MQNTKALCWVLMRKGFKYFGIVWALMRKAASQCGSLWSLHQTCITQLYKLTSCQHFSSDHAQNDNNCFIFHFEWFPNCFGPPLNFKKNPHRKNSASYLSSERFDEKSPHCDHHHCCSCHHHHRSAIVTSTIKF